MLLGQPFCIESHWLSEGCSHIQNNGTLCPSHQPKASPDWQCKLSLGAWIPYSVRQPALILPCCKLAKAKSSTAACIKTTESGYATPLLDSSELARLHRTLRVCLFASVESWSAWPAWSDWEILGWDFHSPLHKFFATHNTLPGTKSLITEIKGAITANTIDFALMNLIWISRVDILMSLAWFTMYYA